MVRGDGVHRRDVPVPYTLCRGSADTHRPPDNIPKNARDHPVVAERRWLRIRRLTGPMANWVCGCGDDCASDDGVAEVHRSRDTRHPRQLPCRSVK